MLAITCRPTKYALKNSFEDCKSRVLQDEYRYFIERDSPSVIAAEYLTAVGYIHGRYHFVKNVELGLALLEENARKGYYRAIFDLATYSKEGRLVPLDVQKAAILYARVATESAYQQAYQQDHEMRAKAHNQLSTMRGTGQLDSIADSVVREWLGMMRRTSGMRPGGCVTDRPLLPTSPTIRRSENV
jgi:TPR repeat protein